MATDTTARAKGKLTDDKEHMALIACQRAFSDLDDEARQRILAYLNSRYGARKTNGE
jgi:hypothetical protein